jgi:hypothetical protein
MPDDSLETKTAYLLVATGCLVLKAPFRVVAEGAFSFLAPNRLTPFHLLRYSVYSIFKFF